MCKLLLDHFDSVFTTPDPSKIIHDPKTFFVEPPVLDASCLTDINFSETVIIDAIKELSGVYPLTQRQAQMVYQPHY